MRRDFSRWAVAAGLAAASVVVAATATYVSGVAGPVLNSRASENREPVSIGVDADSPEQLVLGEIYNRVFIAMGRDSGVTAVDPAHDSNPADALLHRHIDFTIGCTGPLLEELDPAKAGELREKFSADGDNPVVTDASVETYAAAVGTLPGTVMTVDPSPAQGCREGQDDAQGQLPSNIVPLFEKTLFTRGETQRINFITRVLATKDLDEMAERVDDGEPVEDVVAEWLREYASIDFSGATDSNGDKAQVTEVQPPV